MRDLHMRVDGQRVFNNARMMVRAALDGFGLACVLEDLVREQLGNGSLERVLPDWCPPFAGSHRYYPGRRQPSAIFSVLVVALRYRKGAS